MAGLGAEEVATQVQLFKLSKENYYQWKAIAEADLVEKNCWTAVDPGYGDDEMTEDQARINRRARAYLLKHVGKEYIEDISSEVRAHGMWQALRDIHTEMSSLSLSTLLQQWGAFMKPENLSMTEYASTMQTMVRRLKEGGFNITDNQAAMMMIASLPSPKYDDFKRSVEYTPNLTVRQVKTRLYMEENRQKENKEKDDEAAAFAVFKKKQYNTSNGKNQLQKSETFQKNFNEKKNGPRNFAENRNFGENRRRMVKCFACGKWGHMIRECPEAAEEEKRQGDSKGAKPKAAIAKSEENPPEKFKNLICAAGLFTKRENHLWYLDSGATDPMSHDRSLFSNFEPMDVTVKIGKGRLAVCGKGTVELKFSDKCGGYTIRFSNALYVPDLELNLISVRKLTKKGVKVTFEENYAVAMDGKEELFRAYASDELYVLEAEPKIHPVATSKVAAIAAEKRPNGETCAAEKRPDGETCAAEKNLDGETCYEVTALRAQVSWHEKMGHLHEDAVKKIPVLKGIQDEKTEEICSVCVQGKMTRKGFPKKSARQSTKPLELVHTDVMGKVTPMSVGGAVYLLAFTDDYSRYLTVRFLKKKSEVFFELRKFKAESENRLNLKLKAVQSDNGGEYISKEMKEWLCENGILHRLTVPYCPEQNGIAERMFRTITEMARCMLIHASMPKWFWAEAVNYACYIRNMSPNASIQFQIPHELWTGNKLTFDDYDQLKVFGCRAWVHVRGNKFDERAEECAFLGFPKYVKGFRLWSFSKQRVIVAHSVKFDQTVFPFKERAMQKIVRSDTYELFECQITEEEVEIPEAGEVLDEVNAEEVEAEILGAGEANSNEQGPFRRSDRIRKQMEACSCCNFVKCEKPPSTVTEALTSELSSEWEEAMRLEMKCLLDHDAWDIVRRPEGANVIGCKWVYAFKRNQFGEIEKYKARLVAQGFRQIPGIDYGDTYSPVIRKKVVRILMAIAVEKNWVIEHVDVNSAYLNSTLKEIVFMEQPDCFVEEDSRRYVCKLKKCLYGLHQSGKDWNECFNKILLELGLHKCKSDPCLYFNDDKDLFVGVYVDDVALCGDEGKVSVIKEKLSQHLNIKCLGKMSNFLSISVDVGDTGIIIDQVQYINFVLRKCGIGEDARGVVTPLELPKKTMEDSSEPFDSTKYRKVVGSLLYIANATRPDIMFHVCYLSQFNSSPTKENWRDVVHLLRYLLKTKDYKLMYQKTGKQIEVFCDASWGKDQKSWSGFVIKLAGAAVVWRTRKQQAVTRSTLEAEFIAMDEAVREILWLQRMLRELNLSYLCSFPTVIYADNNSAIGMSESRAVTDGNKHIDTIKYALQENVENGEVKFVYVASKDNLADLFTKALTGTRTKDLVGRLGVAERKE